MEYLTKGKSLILVGRLELKEFERPDGTTSKSLELTLDDIEFFGSKSEQEGNGGQQRTGTGETGGGFRKDPAPKQGSFDTEKTPDGDFEEDSIPF